MSDSSDIAGRSRSLVRLRPLRFSLPVRTIARSTLGWIVPLLILLAWEAASRARLVAPNLLPPPSAVLGVAIELARTGEPAFHLRATLGRVAAGFGAGVAAPTPLRAPPATPPL